MDGNLWLAVALGVLFLWPKRAQAQEQGPIERINDTAPIQPDAVGNAEAVPVTSDRRVYEMSLPVDINAFLYMIRACEHRFPNDVTNDACYGIFYGGQRFEDMSDHPVMTGELAPVPLPEAMCKAAGLKSPCFSTAAGAYQFIRPTWARLRDKLDLPDFDVDSQDKAAFELLKESGAYDAIKDRDIEGAIRKSSKIWASLPGNSYQQNPKAMAYALDRFREGQVLYATTSRVEPPPLP